MNSSSLNTLLPNFWTKEKSGKHTPEDLANLHGVLLLKNLKVEPTMFFDEIIDFKFGPISKTSWSEFLNIAQISEYLKPNYVNDALHITTPRPAIGIGEFLFVSCFKNIGFAKTSGDLIDLNTNELIECKGNRAVLSGDNNSVYKEMNDSVMTTICSIFNENLGTDHFNRDAAKEISRLIGKDKDKTLHVFRHLQNLINPIESTAINFAKLYQTENDDLFTVVGAMQIYIYMNLNRGNKKNPIYPAYLMMANDDGFCCFKRPTTAAEALLIAQNVKLSSWGTGYRGMSVGI